MFHFFFSIFTALGNWKKWMNEWMNEWICFGHPVPEIRRRHWQRERNAKTRIQVSGKYEICPIVTTEFFNRLPPKFPHVITSQSLNIWPKYFRCFKNCGFYNILFRISKLRRKRTVICAVIFYVQRIFCYKLSNILLNSSSQSTFEMSTRLSHKLDVFCEPQCGLLDWVLQQLVPY